jgi:hypothetical protein
MSPQVVEAAPIVLAEGAQHVLADAAAVVDAVRLEPLIGPPSGDMDAAKVRARELNAGIAETALAKRAATPPQETTPPTASEIAVDNIRVELRRGEAAHLLGNLGLSRADSPHLDSRAIARHAHEQGIDTRVAVYSAAARAGIVVEGLVRLR